MGLRNDRFEIEDSDPEPDLSPMIDCVFILLIFFIVTATFVEEDGFQVNRPESSSSVSASETPASAFPIVITTSLVGSLSSTTVKPAADFSCCSRR